MRGITRRTALALAGGTWAAAALGRPAHAYASNNLGLPLLPLALHNAAGPGRALFFSIIGTTRPASPAGNWYFVSDLHGNVTRCQPSSGLVSLSLPDPAENAVLRLQFPQLSAVRLYISLDRPLQVSIDANGSPSAPAGWVPSDQNYQTPFDWVELTWDGPAGNTVLGGNTTEVDMFGLPLNLQLSGHDGIGNPLTLAAGFGTTGAYSNILKALAFAPAPWNALLVAGSGGAATRAISPYHGMENGVFPKTQLDHYIARVFTHYRTATLATSAAGVAYAGQVSGGSLVFTPAGGGTPIVFPQPTTYETYTSGPLPTVPGGAAGAIGAALQAAFMRTTLLLSGDLPDTDAANFYRAAPVNLYAKIIHQYALNHHAYAFGFDDDAGQSSYIAVGHPTGMRVTVLPLAA